ncbi:hypothetical protein SK128_000916 [Halocaridina rubra]|uniref:Uncharacterized protein n=1 Tax=Halocaridina rubra TaxID=373956 RepID=A0AAN8ZRX1_HALRR
MNTFLQIRGSMKEGMKRTVFCVNTVPLVYQQGKAIETHTRLKVGKYEGSQNVDLWDDKKWEEELEKHEVIILTSQILLQLVLHGRLPLNKVNLIIMDECHHAVGNHPMREVLREYEKLKDMHSKKCPHIMGLTASVINRKCKSFEVMKAIHTLEMTMNSALVTSKNQEEIKNCITQPKEILVMYRKDSMTSYQELINAQLSGMLFEVCERDDIEMKAKTFIKKRINNIVHIMTSLGDWCVARAIKYEMENLEDSAEAEEVHLLRELYRDLRTRFNTIYKVCVGKEVKMANPKDHVSHHVKKLMEILSSIRNSTVAGLIFVERRNTAKILYDLLLELAKQNVDLAYIKPLYIVSATAHMNTDLRLAELECRKVLKSLDKFRNGVANFIVSTSVLEEGVDIRCCNLVIRFDKPMNYRAYVQSRGRSRADSSRYVLMVEDANHQKFISDLDVYREIEKSLKTLCLNRNLPTDDETRMHFKEDEIILPYEPYGIEGPKVTANSAVSLINHYLGNLPQDKFTNLTPQVIYTRGRNCIKAGIILPVSSPLRTTVYGKFMNTQDLAKKSAALEVCKILHAMKELDHSLCPVKPKIENITEGLLDIDFGTQAEEVIGLGTKKHMQICEKEICESFSNTDSRVYQLYSIEILPAYPELQRFSVNSTTSEWTLGLLCSGVLIHCPFNLYGPRFGEISIKIKHVKEMQCIRDATMKKIVNFHKQTMEWVYCINKYVMEFSPEKFGHNMYVVPLKGGLLCDDLLNEMNDKSFIRKESSSCGHLQDFDFNRSLYQHAVIYPLYCDDDIMYYVTDILDHLSPSSEFPESISQYGTYENYFKVRYGKSITNRQQPLLAVKHLPKALNYLKKANEVTIKKKKNWEPQKFIPELCGVLPFKLSFWWQLSCIPSILHRLNSFGIAYSLSVNINTNTVPTLKSINLFAFDFKWAGKLAQQTAGNKNLAVVLSKKNDGDMQPFMLVHALTLLNAQDGYDLERLEVLGDAFLKFVVGDYVFLKFPMAHEGKLSVCRSYFVCNKTLYKFGKKLGIPNKLQTLHFSPRVNGFIPGFGVKKDVENQLSSVSLPHDKWYKFRTQCSLMDADEVFQDMDTEKKLTSVIEDQSVHSTGKELCYNPWKQQRVSDKSVADSVEALIGAYLLKCGSKAAKDFIHFLGIGIFDVSICYVIESNCSCSTLLTLIFCAGLISYVIIIHVITRINGYFWCGGRKIISLVFPHEMQNPTMRQKSEGLQYHLL